MQGLKNAILAIFQKSANGPIVMDWIGFALLVQPSQSPQWTRKILFGLGFYESLEHMGG